VPKEWHNLESKDAQKQICNYLLPLIKGETEMVLTSFDTPSYFEINYLSKNK
jgi:hypothetical protein